MLIGSQLSLLKIEIIRWSYKEILIKTRCSYQVLNSKMIKSLGIYFVVVCFLISKHLKILTKEEYYSWYYTVNAYVLDLKYLDLLKK